jgi:tight adherence protein B
VTALNPLAASLQDHLTQGVLRSGLTGLPLGLHRQLVIGFVGLAFGLSVYRSVANPRGVIRRMATGYVADIDAKQRSMFLPPTGFTIAWCQVGALFSLLLLYGAIGEKAVLVLLGAVAILPPYHVRRQLTVRRERIDNQANGFCLALANALKSTSSIGDALKGACDVTSSPLKDEVQTVLRQVRVGSTLEEALLALSARVQSMALDVVVSALLIGRQTGGDLPRILEGTAGSLRELKRLEQLTDKVTRSAKQSLYISAGITAGLAAGLPYLFPGFMDPLRNSIQGQIVLANLAGLYLLALFLGYRITRKSI